MSHIHVSEREGAHVWPDGRADDARWEDCLWCTLAEALHDAGLIGDDQCNHAFAEQLRAASGEPPTGGSNFDNARDGVRAVLGLELPPTVEGTDAILEALVPGTVAVVNGSMGAFPSGSPWRAPDPGFTGYHSSYAANPPGNTEARKWWCNPLEPEYGYAGEWMPDADLASFLAAFPSGGQALVWPLAVALPTTPTQPLPGDAMTSPIAEYVTATGATVAPPLAEAAIGHKANIRSAPILGAATLLRPVVSEDWGGIVGWVDGAADSGSTRWLLHIAPNGTPEYTHSSNVADLVLAGAPGPAPAPVVIPPNEQACKVFSDAAVAQEQGRIRTVLGI